MSIENDTIYIWDSDNIVVTIKEVPKDGATTSFEIINNFGETISSSNGTQYSKEIYIFNILRILL